jgi:glutamate decarboxylase
VIPFIRSADQEEECRKSDNEETIQPSLVEFKHISELQSILPLDLPTVGLGPDGFLTSLRAILKNSINTFSPGFLSKLYAATNAPGIASDLILSVLNTNLHVYQVSPSLTVIEKHTAKALASLFGFDGPRAGGISVQGGSASNLTSIIVARNTLYPSTKRHGNSESGRQLVLFTSAHGHYSIEKAAQVCGFGSASVVAVPVSRETGAMDPSALESQIVAAIDLGKTPFYVNATAGTTVLGSFDPFPEIAAVARRYNMWFHIDASWGGPFIFSHKLRHKLGGSGLADSITVNPHKMMGVPVTCSFLLAKDLQQFHQANTLPAGYLFHGDATGDDDAWKEPDDLADLTLQCGRRGDSLKLFLSWQYYGTGGYASQVERAYDVAAYMTSLLAGHEHAVLVSQDPPPCLQVCFYFAPNRLPVVGDGEGQLRLPPQLAIGKGVGLAELAVGRYNSLVTERIVRALLGRGFMVDFAPPLEGHGAKGKFIRVALNVQTEKATAGRLIVEVVKLGFLVKNELEREFQLETRHEE